MLDEYLKLEAQLLCGSDSDDDVIMERMDEVWLLLTEAERERLNSR